MYFLFYQILEKFLHHDVIISNVHFPQIRTITCVRKEAVPAAVFVEEWQGGGQIKSSRYGHTSTLAPQQQIQRAHPGVRSLEQTVELGLPRLVVAIAQFSFTASLTLCKKRSSAALY